MQKITQTPEHKISDCFFPTFQVSLVYPSLAFVFIQATSISQSVVLTLLSFANLLSILSFIHSHFLNSFGCVKCSLRAVLFSPTAIKIIQYGAEHSVCNFFSLTIQVLHLIEALSP